METLTINDYIAKLAEAEKPHLVLAQIFTLLFDRDIQKNDWGMLQKQIKIYGRWNVLEAFLRASGNINFSVSDNKYWGYFNAILVSLVNDEVKSVEKDLSAKDQIERTTQLVKDMSEIHEIKLRNKDE